MEARSSLPKSKRAARVAGILMGILTGTMLALSGMPALRELAEAAFEALTVPRRAQKEGGNRLLSVNTLVQSRRSPRREWVSKSASHLATPP